MEHTFHAHGKILLTAEFMILHGAKALAVPLNVGQELRLAKKREPGMLHWNARYREQTWFACKLEIDPLTIVEASDRVVAQNLRNILEKLIRLKPGFKDQLEKYDVVTDLGFDPGFGFGSSSTLTSLLAQWAEVDPLQFHFSISRGSGYDVACASSETPILYQVINEMPVIENIEYLPPFADHMWLVYLGSKQETSGSVADFLEKYIPRNEDIELFTNLTLEFLHAGTLDKLGSTIEEHEKKLSALLGLDPIKKTIFHDLEGYAKSLGAWGGDFALLLSPWHEEKITGYLHEKGIQHGFRFNDLVR